MTHNFPYLKDVNFLNSFDKTKLKQQFVKLIVLSFNEMPIAEIQGKVLSGNLSLDGSSAMRRTANISLVADEYENDLTDTKHLLSINKKIEVLIGFTNTTGEYTDFPVLWFPQGTFVIITPNISHGMNGINISLTLHDKMALLNGECGGTLPASIIFHQVEDIDENGQIYIRQPTIYQIIQQLVNHFGGQQLRKIIISDIDDKIKKVMKWTGSTPLYLYQSLQDGQLQNHFSTNYSEAQRGSGIIQEFEYGEDVGYILTDFIYPGELVSNAGDTIVTILDKIKNMLGNYEYFYDVDGNFRFQQIKNYLNTSYSTFKINEIQASNYLVDYSGGKSVYTFTDADIITTFSNSPQYQQIKNDFIIWGKRQTVEGKEVPIRYHLAIDTKPPVGNEYKVFFFVDPDDGITKAKKPVEFANRDGFPEKGEVGNYYLAADTAFIYKWAPDVQTYEKTSYTIETVTATDYRTELYMAGVASQPFGLDSNYYYTELKNQWPKLYNMRGSNPGFFKENLQQPNNIDFFLDFIDTTSSLAQFSVNNIGRRTAVLVDDMVNCIFEPDNPDIVIIQAGTAETSEIREECENRKQEYVQVRTELYSLLSNGGSLRSAYEQMRKELYQYTNYNEQVSLTMLPVYYLEPNIRITIRDVESGIYGDYMIKSFSLPLDVNGTMSLSCTRALERI